MDDWDERDLVSDIARAIVAPGIDAEVAALHAVPHRPEPTTGPWPKHLPGKPA